MTVVFIGGSRRVTRLADEVVRRLEKIVERRLPVVVGDANGADRAVQAFFAARGYELVTVFCTGGVCRNNVGGWPLRAAPAPAGRRGFEFYAAKDVALADEATVGLMLWDGTSRGTLANVERLVARRKPVLVYSATRREFVAVRGPNDLAALRRRVGAPDDGPRGAAADEDQAALF